MVSWQWRGSSNSEWSFLSVLWMSHCGCHSLENWPDLPRIHGPLWNSKKHHNAVARHLFYIHVLWFWTAGVLFLPWLYFPQGCTEGSVVRKYRKNGRGPVVMEIMLDAAGSNSHNNGNPAGDGQAGDSGEGTTGQYIVNTLCAPSLLCRDLCREFLLLLLFGTLQIHTARIPIPNPWPVQWTSPLCHWYCPFCPHALSVLPRFMISISKPLIHSLMAFMYSAVFCFWADYWSHSLCSGCVWLWMSDCSFT